MKAWLWILALLLWPSSAQADELRPGYIDLTQQSSQEWQLVWKQTFSVPPTTMPSPPEIPILCKFAGEPEIGTSGAAVIGAAQLRCEGPLGGQTIGMPGLIGQSDMLVRIKPLEEPSQALRLTGREPVAKIARQPSTLQVLRTYFVLGVEHILVGWDHLLFVIALVLLVRKPKAVILAATAFTLSHSVTLAAAALGFVGLSQRPVEAMIALSIIFLALEILRPAGESPSLARRHPGVVAFLFGLLHGFGFAGALHAIGLPDGEIIPALLAFNIGVEAGQLLVIGGLLAALAALARFAKPWSEQVIRLAAYAIGITGAYWMIDRTIL
ncbi:HupE/UreJ family protein [Pontixanthobacter gangjinensis]|uniref:HupE/UreJ family protein n=1 Tax=Pontixanthobacter gangjinensis TaxID=1028742 RepID=A0A6I4SK16_9SPHN|nr:HupE/UreJ family protein [Pontixanthobacter gangjinensis]MXO56015.1 HupE/UreJ family protein [Pontixanthobacter gangjinensis]